MCHSLLKILRLKNVITEGRPRDTGVFGIQWGEKLANSFAIAVLIHKIRPHLNPRQQEVLFDLHSLDV